MRLATAVYITMLWASSLLGQTLTLTGPATARPGSTIQLNLQLANTTTIAALQWTSLTVPSGWVVRAVAGAASVTAAKELYCDPPWKLCLAVGINANLYAPGVVAVYTVTIPPNAAPGPVTIPLSSLVAATLDGGSTPITAGTAYSVQVLHQSDLNGDGKTDILDLQLMILEILGQSSVANDQNKDGVDDVLDAQIVARAAQGP